MNTQISENTLDVSLKLGLSFVISCCITTVFLVYMINAPYILTQQSKMIKEYYYDNAFNSFIFDIFLTAAYLLIAQYIIYLLDVENFSLKLVIVALTTLFISGMFYNMYMSYPLDKSSFFSRWFYNAGFSAVIYDIIYLLVLYIITVSIFTHIIIKK